MSARERQRCAATLVAVALCSCVSLGEKLRADLPPDFPARAHIALPSRAAPAHADTCGPEAASLALFAAGIALPPAALVSRLMTPARRGTFQVDLLALGRRLQLRALPLSGMTALLEQIAVGHPVIVLLNLRHELLPQWHYAVVAGFDLETETVLLHAGAASPEPMPLERFARRWAAAQSWGLVYLKSEDAASRGSTTHASRH